MAAVAPRSIPPFEDGEVDLGILVCRFLGAVVRRCLALRFAMFPAEYEVCSVR